MKKRFSLSFAALALFCFSLVGCGSSGNEPAEKPDDIPPPSPVQGVGQPGAKDGLPPPPPVQP